MKSAGGAPQERKCSPVLPADSAPAASGSQPPGTWRLVRDSTFEFFLPIYLFCLLIHWGNSQSTSSPYGTSQGCSLNTECLPPLWVS
ncbi:hypothetical protein ACRRTK_015342 [Alexandromys fortis]